MGNFLKKTIARTAGILTTAGVLLFAAYMAFPDVVSKYYEIVFGKKDEIILASESQLDGVKSYVEQAIEELEEAVIPGSEQNTGNEVIEEEADLEQPSEEKLAEPVNDGGITEDASTEDKKNMGIISSPVSSSYAYSFLDESAQKVYLEVLSTLQHMSSDVSVSTKNPDVLDHVFNCVMLDHPELFYVKGYSVTKYTRGDNIEKIDFSGTYTVDFDTAVKRQLLVDAAADRILSGISRSASEYDKVKYIYEYIIKNTDYDVSSAENQNILSVLLNGRSVCQGYAETTQYLLNKLGVFCILVDGTVKGTESHTFNIVRIDGEYYYLDSTWGDASYNLIAEDGSSALGVPDINYDYLNITRSDIERTHVIKETVPLPECDSLNANYYVREGLYFDNVDPDKFSKVFQEAYEKEEKMLSIKFSDADSLEKGLGYLIDEEHIFEYLQSGNSVNYVVMKEENRILFYL